MVQGDKCEAYPNTPRQRSSIPWQDQILFCLLLVFLAFFFRPLKILPNHRNDDDLVQVPINLDLITFTLLELLAIIFCSFFLSGKLDITAEYLNFIELTCNWFFTVACAASIEWIVLAYVKQLYYGGRLTSEEWTSGIVIMFPLSLMAAIALITRYFSNGYRPFAAPGSTKELLYDHRMFSAKALEMLGKDKDGIQLLSLYLKVYEGSQEPRHLNFVDYLLLRKFFASSYKASQKKEWTPHYKRSPHVCSICKASLKLQEEVLGWPGCGHLVHVYCGRVWLDQKKSCSQCIAPLSVHLYQQAELLLARLVDEKDKMSLHDS